MSKEKCPEVKGKQSDWEGLGTEMYSDHMSYLFFSTAFTESYLPVSFQNYSMS